jgi:D-alanine-D-alanine ligase
MNVTKPKVALFVGGTSPEKEVSKDTGKAIYEVLKSLNYPTVVIDPGLGLNQPEDVEKIFDKNYPGEISNQNYISVVNSELLDDVDLVFLALHGKYAEDGTMQALLELRGKKYTGSGILASSMGMDKNISKILFENVGVKTAKWFVVNGNLFNVDEINKRIKSEFGFPCIIKPNDQGSTVGLTLLKNPDETGKAVKLALQFSSKALIEEYIPGRELTVAILEGEPLPVLEIVPKSGLYDYHSKYTKGMSEYIVPAEIPENVFKHTQFQAQKAFNVLGCKDYARIDFRLNEKNEIYCLEVNTLPGMTATSLVPKMSKAVGISFEQLIQKIIQLALR